MLALDAFQGKEASYMKIPATFSAKVVNTVTGVVQSVTVSFSPSFGISLPISFRDDLKRRGALPYCGCVRGYRLLRESSPWLAFFKFASLGESFFILVSA